MALATLTSNQAQNSGDFYQYPVGIGQLQTAGFYGWPSSVCYHHTVSVDRGEKAFRLAQKLIESELIEAKSSAQFIALMNAILEVI